MSSIIQRMGARLRLVAFGALALAVIVPGIALATGHADHNADGVGEDASLASTTTLVEPCALFDTRGFLPSAATRTTFDQNQDGGEDGPAQGGDEFQFYARTSNGQVNTSQEFNQTTTTSGEYSQGGEVGCDVPDDATGLFLNVVVLSPTFAGNLAAYANDAEDPNAEHPAGVIVFNGGLNVANAVYVSLDDMTGTEDGSDFDFEVFVNGPSSETVDLRGVLLGYTSTAA